MDFKSADEENKYLKEKDDVVMSNKKVPTLKQEPNIDDVIELLALLDPRGIYELYFILVGILTTRGYKIINWFFIRVR